MLDEESQKQQAQERAEDYVESIFMHTGEAVETFVNYFDIGFQRGVMSPNISSLRNSELGFESALEKISNAELISLLLSSAGYKKEITQELRSRVYQLARQHGVIDNMIERIGNDIFNEEQ